MHFVFQHRALSAAAIRSFCLWQRNIFGILVVAEDEEHRVPELSVFSPFRVGNLSNKSWRQERRTFDPRKIFDRRMFPFERLKFAIKRGENIPSEARAYSPDVLELSVLVG